MTTPSAAENKAKKSVENTVKLPSGKILTKIDFKGKHIREAQRLADGDQSKTMFAMMVVASLIDGKRITIEELDEMCGKDVLFMTAEFGELFT